MSDLTAKARRAAEWLKARDTVKFSPEIRKGTKVRWLIQALNTGVYFERTDREFIAFCEDRGWQDQDQEADGVEWKPNEELADIEGGFIRICGNSKDSDSFYWAVYKNSDRVAKGLAPTRAEARRQAVEAARGMG